MQNLEVSGAIRPLYGSLGVRGLLSSPAYFCVVIVNNLPHAFGLETCGLARKKDGTYVK